MKINQKQIENVLALPGPEQYDHFVKVVAAWEKVWGLYQDGWALAATNEGEKVFPLWPAKEYATLCAVRDWEGYEPKSFSVHELLDDLLPKLERDHVWPGIFFTPSGKGVTPEISQLATDLRREMSRY